MLSPYSPRSIVPLIGRAAAAVGLCLTLGAAGDSAPTPFPMLGDMMTLAVTGAQTNGASATIVSEVPPGGGPPAHVHTREDETFVVVRGQFRFWQGTRAIDAGPGTVLYMPRNVPHQFVNVGSTPGELVVTLAPAGLEKMFLTISERGLTVPKDLTKIVKLGADYGINYLPPLAPQAPTK